MAQKSPLLDLPFPAQGLDVSSSRFQQFPGTSPDLRNVRPWDHALRRRGARRPGLRRHLDQQVNGGAAIQDLNHIVGANFELVGAVGLVAVGRTAGGVYSTLDRAGAVTVTAGTVSGSIFYQSSCWDDQSQVYVCKVESVTLTVQKFDASGNSVWSITKTLHSTSRGCWGIAYFDGMLYLHVFGYPDSGSCILRLDATDGSDVEAAWKSTAAGSLGAYPNGVLNRTLAIGGGVVSVIAGASGQRFDATTGALLGSGGLTIGVTANRVVVDRAGVSYVVGRDLGGGWAYVRRVEIDGTIAWNSAGVGDFADIKDVCWDAKNNRLGVVGADVHGSGGATGHSFATLDVLTGAVIASQDASGVTTWDQVLADSDGAFVLWRDNNTTTLTRLVEALTVDPAWPQDLSNRSANVISINNGTTVPLSDRLAIREIRGLAVAGGTVRRWDSVHGLSAVSHGTAALAVGAPVIFSAQFGQDCFFADGVSAKYYKAASNAMLDWTPTSGSLPIDTAGNRCKLIVTWRARILMAGLRGDPQNYFASKVGFPLVWDYGAASDGPARAFLGSGTPAGLVGDVVNCLIPYSDDLCLAGCDHTLQILRGDPADNGRIDLLTNAVGCAWGRPFTMDSSGAIYFLASRCGVYRMTPASLPEKLSAPIDPLLETTNLDTTVCRMAWEDRRQGLHVFLTPLSSVATFHFYWDAPTASWWLDQFADVRCDPVAVHVFDGDAADDRRVLLGSRNGWVRTFDADAPDDDGAAIDSYCWIGPVQSKDGGQLLVTDLQGTLAEDSGALAWSLHGGHSAEHALGRDARFSGTLAAGRNRSRAVRSAGHAHYVKISGVNGSQWSLERLQANVRPSGPARQRIF